ncbi:hypothetical protein [Parendozoicomonas haliclonae]|uniref:Lipoprotein n=1 Tax=Parendozoicomonas haliclonae TaxID=1960125 RepID=A0A1X7AM75_9GAMM|nr:hypothetical protein [Parendozoicomonas haliclonae]SMA49323.1 hypothetical protein EHSB41UT_03186 [Parendozoicomonas haliclonae]
MVRKGFLPKLAATALLTLIVSGCANYPFKYKPYNPPQRFSSWSEVEAIVQRLEGYAEHCFIEQQASGSCETLAEELTHSHLRIQQTTFPLAPDHIQRLETLADITSHLP